MKIEAKGDAITNLPDWIQLQVFAVPHLHPFEYYSLASHYSIVNPAESNNNGMLAVGAAERSNTYQIWNDSSRGPTVNGTVKPDIVGVHKVSSVALGGEFAGTSQAAPHIGGLTALVIQALTTPAGTPPAPTQVVGFLKQHAVNRSTPGPDNTWGHGFAYLPTLTPTPTPLPPAVPTGFTATATAGDRSIDLDWDDAARATGYQVQQSGGLTTTQQFRPGRSPG